MRGKLKLVGTWKERVWSGVLYHDALEIHKFIASELSALCRRVATVVSQEPSPAGAPMIVKFRD